ncbi:MAG TPA: diaminobutyrate acetyltransferase [Desulfobacteraceae bacterium]|nr:diaminobutyrate acetyltransferase [Desulfobacteraceae bacterium]
MTREITMRSPVSRDAQAMRQLAIDSRVLSVNSTYYYALMARMFGDTSLIAEEGGRLCGYVTAFRPPLQKNTIFVWQVGVADWIQGKGIGKQMLNTIIKQQQPEFLEASIAPDNLASRNLFTSVARQWGADHVYEEPFFTVEDLGSQEGEELLFRLGPLSY